MTPDIKDLFELEILLTEMYSDSLRVALARDSWNERHPGSHLLDVGEFVMRANACKKGLRKLWSGDDLDFVNMVYLKEIIRDIPAQA